MAVQSGASMNPYVIEAVLKEKRQDMLQEAERLRRIREYEEHLQSQAIQKRGVHFYRMVGKIEIALGNLLIRVGMWLTRRQTRRGYGLVCKG